MPKPIATSLFLLSLATCMGSHAAEPEKGSIAGHVRFLGMPSPPQTILVTDGTTIQHRDLVVDPETKGLQNTFVVLADVPKQPPVKDLQPAVMDQRDWVFLPRVLGVRQGQAVEFQNNDGVNHGVSAMASKGENQFNVVLGAGRTHRITFEPERNPIVIGCALHPWMRAYVYVVEHPWFAVTDAKGVFVINDVPAGKYRMEWVHPDSKLTATRQVEVKPGRKTEVDLDWESLPKRR